MSIFLLPEWAQVLVLILFAIVVLAWTVRFAIWIVKWAWAFFVVGAAITANEIKKASDKLSGQ
jgi:uncharacterized membrane protein